jgi:hypothetical protein
MSAVSASPYREGDAGRRPAIWVPGVLFIETEIDRGSHAARIRLGPEAGVWWGRVELRDWKTQVHLVERRALTKTISRDAGLVLPESQIDPERAPYVHRFAAAAPLVQVDEREEARLMELGVRVYTVGFERRVDDVLWVLAAGGGEPPLEVTAPYHDLLHAALGRGAEEHFEEDREILERSGFIDRVLRAATRGVVDEVRIDRAIMLRSFGEIAHYQGIGVDPRRERLAPDEATHRARGLEAQLRAVHERAETMQEDAARVVAALEQAAPEDESTRVPVYGEVHRLRAPAFKIAGTQITYPGSRISVPDASGRVKERLFVPEEVIWCVTDVEPWLPPLPADVLEEQMRAIRRGRSGSLSCAGAAAVVALVAAAIAILAAVS